MADLNQLAMLLAEDPYYSAGRNVMGQNAYIPRGSFWENFGAGALKTGLGGLLEGIGQARAHSQLQNQYEDLTNALTGKSPEEQIDVLMQNPATAELGLKMKMEAQQDAAKQRAELAKALTLKQADALYDKGVVFTDQGVQEVPGYTSVFAGREGQISGAQADARNRAELQYAGPIAASRAYGALPADIEKARITGEMDLAQAKALEEMRLKAQGAAKIPDTEDALRKELTGSDEYKNLSTLQAQVSGLENSKLRNDPVADLSFVYGIAKVLDPGSAVREGEFKLASGAASPLAQFQGDLNKLAGGASLLPETRQRIIEVAKDRMLAAQAQYNTVAEPRVRMAKERGANPENVAILPIKQLPAPDPKKFSSSTEYINAYRQWEAANANR